jgi:Tfp pilus assembly protein PilN
MADIDMIPRSYREASRVRRTLSAYGIALALVVLAGAGASALLRWRVTVETPRLMQLRADAVQAGAMRAQLTGAQQRRDALAGDAEALAALRGAGAATQLAQVLDATLDDKVWIEHLRFTRTRERLNAPLPSPLPPGTVQVNGAQAWQLGSHVELAGQALDPAAMTRFLSALAAQPALAQVRLLNSGAGSASSGSSSSSNAAAEQGGTVAFGAAWSFAQPGETR